MKHRYSRPVLFAAATLLAGFASAQSSLTMPNNSAGTPLDTPPVITRGTTSMLDTPTRTESSLSAFDKLDASHRGYITQEDANRLPGNSSFSEADRNRDSRLDANEFQRFWDNYQSGSGN